MSEFTLDQAATVVRVRPSTIHYWLRTYADVLDVPKDADGHYRFSAHHIRTLETIREAALDMGHTVHKVRRLLRTTPPTAETDYSTRIEELLAEVRALREEVAFLAEESKELQRVIGVLVQHALASGHGNTAADSRRDERTSGRGVERDLSVVERVHGAGGTALTQREQERKSASVSRAERTTDPNGVMHRWSPPRLQ